MNTGSDGVGWVTRTTVSCRDVRGLLSPHHDGELGLETQIAVEAHMSRCRTCARHRKDLVAIQTLLRHAANRHEWAGGEGAERDDAQRCALTAVVEQAVSERRRGWPGVIDRLMVAGTAWWIPSGALAVTTAAAIILGSVLTLLTPTHSHSLASVLLALGSPGSNANPVLVARGVTPPQLSLDLGLPPVLTAPPTVASMHVTLAAVITREGEVSWMEVVSPHLTDELIRDLSLLSTATRFKPALYGGLPVAVNVVWLLEQTTVRPPLAVAPEPPVVVEVPERI